MPRICGVALVLEHEVIRARPTPAHNRGERVSFRVLVCDNTCECITCAYLGCLVLGVEAGVGIPRCNPHGVRAGGRVLCVCRYVYLCLCGCEGSALVRVPFFSFCGHFRHRTLDYVCVYKFFGAFLSTNDKNLSTNDK